MKKLVALVFALLMVSVSMASASDVSITGSYYMRGTYADNWDGTGNNVKDYGIYDQELTFDVEFKMSPYTKVFTRVEAVDGNMGVNSQAVEGRPIGANGATYDDNIVLEQVYGQHTFASTKTTLRVGLMGANAWATAFGDEGGEANRIWVMQPTAVGTWFGVIEKGSSIGANLTVSETGNPATGDDADQDTYILGLMTKMGSVTVMPLVAYTTVGANDLDVYVAQLGLTGTMNNIGWEAEFHYRSTEAGDQFSAAGGAVTLTDTELYGAYGNIWAQLDALKVGGLVAYGSYDDNGGTVTPAGAQGSGFEFGDDFTAGGALLLGDDIFTNGSNDSLNAVTLVAAYASYAVSEKLTLGAYLGYADSNVKSTAANPNNVWDDASAWEVSASADYKITNNLTYTVAAGIAELEVNDNWVNAAPAVRSQPDKAVEIFHRLSFAF